MTDFEAWLAIATPEQIEHALDVAHDVILRDISGEQAQARAMQRTCELFDKALLKVRALMTVH